MTRPLARPHTLNIEDAIWNRLVEHSGKRGESASAFTNLVLRDALGMIPREPEMMRDYQYGDISAAATKPPETQMDVPIATSPTLRPVSKTEPTRGDLPERPSPWEMKYGKGKK